MRLLQIGLGILLMIGMGMGQTRYIYNPITGQLNAYSGITNPYSGNLSVVPDTSVLGPETFSQTTFSPSHTKWAVSGDMAFVANVPTFTATGNGGSISQLFSDFATPGVGGNMYQFDMVLQSVVPGDTYCSLNLGGAPAIVFYPTEGLQPINGHNIFPVFLAGSPSDSVAWACGGTTGSFEIVSMSLKQAVNGGGGLVVNSRLYASQITSNRYTNLANTTLTGYSQIVASATEPATCTVDYEVGNIWIDNATSTTVFKVCQSVGGVVGWQNVLTTNGTGGGTVTLTPQAVGSLPTCNAGAAGTLATVNDALAPAWGASVANGGAAFASVVCNGSAWTVTGK